MNRCAQAPIFTLYFLQAGKFQDVHVVDWAVNTVLVAQGPRRPVNTPNSQIFWQARIYVCLSQNERYALGSVDVQVHITRILLESSLHKHSHWRSFARTKSDWFIYLLISSSFPHLFEVHHKPLDSNLKTDFAWIQSHDTTTLHLYLVVTKYWVANPTNVFLFFMIPRLETFKKDLNKLQIKSLALKYWVGTTNYTKIKTWRGTANYLPNIKLWPLVHFEMSTE